MEDFYEKSHHHLGLIDPDPEKQLPITPESIFLNSQIPKPEVTIATSQD